jgi:hypothetical protein
MWKTRFIVVKAQFACPQVLWKRLWKTFQPVEKTDKRIFHHLFHKDEITTACGNVENFV